MIKPLRLPIDTETYDLRFDKALHDLKQIARMKPRSKYLYPLMQSVPFQDFETAMSAIIEDHANDKE